METNVRTPMQVFNLPQYLVVPLFQRPYVWDEVDQWQPLWGDVRRVAELRLRDPLANPTHFLGAVVVQAHEGPIGAIPAANVIDGQQRLTTLQLLMDATAGVLEGMGEPMLAGQLASLTHNSSNFVTGDESALKIRHTNRDSAAFHEVMEAESPVDYVGLQHSGSLIARAHRYFASEVVEWLREGDDATRGLRAHSLVYVLANGLQLVAINLTAAENSQEIFETLNARGTPLTAADLIKNFVFQRLEQEGADAQHAYQHLWPFESKFWEASVSVGRYLVSRSSLFLNQWLVARTGEEIGPQSTFTRFKAFVEHDDSRSMTELLVLIKMQATQYEAWTVASLDEYRPLSPVEMAVYRMRSNDLELLKPLLIWLHEPERALPQHVIDDVVHVAESWVMRRLLLRLTGSDLGRVIADIVNAHSKAPAEELRSRVESHLARLNSASNYWPGDEELARELAAAPVYRRFKRGRLRCVLEAVEDVFRSESDQATVARKSYPIEHVLPQKWEDHWSVDSEAAAVVRSEHVHLLGNLTLLTASLNSKVSNGAWDAKRDALRRHDTLLLNSRMLAAVGDMPWDEAAIDARTARIIEKILEIWPVPADHAGVVVGPGPKESSAIEIKDLLVAGLLDDGAVLVPRRKEYEHRVAKAMPGGRLELEGATFGTPSGAAKALIGRHTNGWTFWRLEDGRTLDDLRIVLSGVVAASKSGVFDWSPLHQILESLPEGTWTTYGDLADAVGTAAQAVGNHIAACDHCANAHRVLTAHGSISSGFAWTDSDDHRDPHAMLLSEGLGFPDGRADPAARLGADALQVLVAGDDSL